MPIKGIFNKNENSKNTSLEQFEKQVLRINTLEVQIKELMRFEKQVRLSLLEAVKEEETKKFGTKRKSKSEESLTEIEFKQELNLYNKKLNELKKRIVNLEQQMSEIETSIQDSQRHEVLDVDKAVKEEWIRNVVERFLSEKIKDQIQKEEKLYERLEELERNISIQTNRESNEFKSDSNGRETKQQLNGNTNTVLSLEPIEKSDKLIENKEETTDRFMSENLQIKKENILLEQVEKLIDEYKRLSKSGQVMEGTTIPESQQKNIENSSLEDTQETRDGIVQQEPLLKTVYIENLYLDKYEQNNNFAQVGIKELSGTLNIGATYGIDAIPKKVIESAQEDIETIKANKEKMKENEKSKNSFRTENNGSPNSPPEEKGFGDVTLEVMEEHKVENSSITEGRKPVSSPEEDVFTKIDIEEVEHQSGAEKPSGEELSSSPLEDELYTDINIEDDPSNGENSS